LIVCLFIKKYFSNIIAETGCKTGQIILTKKKSVRLNKIKQTTFL
jgi:hypothetical protein